MSNSTLGLLIGGFIPAIFFAATGIFSKIGTKGGIGVGPYLIAIGLGIVLVGIVVASLNRDWAFPFQGTWPSFAAGLVWGVGSGLFTFALSKYHTPVSQLTPLYNLNTLLVVLFGLIFFAEWKEVESIKLVAGSLLVVAGSVLVSVA